MHTDAAQALGKRRVDVEDLGVDFLTIVGHKVCVQGPPSFLVDITAMAEWSHQLCCSLSLSSERQVPVREQVLRCCDSSRKGVVLGSFQCMYGAGPVTADS